MPRAPALARWPHLIAMLVAIACEPTAHVDSTAQGLARADEAGSELRGLRPRLFAYRRIANGVEPLDDGAWVQAGDLVQLGYAAAGNRHGVIISIDGRGEVTLHHPPAGVPPRLHRRGRHPLGHAFELDAAENFERFVLVTSGDEPIDPLQVMAAAQRVTAHGPGSATTPLEIPSRWHQTSLLLRKRP